MTAPKPPSQLVRHQSGRYTLEKGLQTVLNRLEEPGDWTERLGLVGVSLRAWRGDLIEGLGGDAVVSPQQRALIELATRSHLMVESVDRYILGMPCLVNKSRRQLFAVVRERQTLADGLARVLGQLGLERRQRGVPSLDELSRQLIAERPQEPQDDTLAVQATSDGAEPPDASEALPEAEEPLPEDLAE